MNIDDKKLVREMARKRYTVARLAKAAGVAASSVSAMLHGRKTIRVDTLGKIADALGVEPADILTD